MADVKQMKKEAVIKAARHVCHLRQEALAGHREWTGREAEETVRFWNALDLLRCRMADLDFEDESESISIGVMDES